MKMFSWCVLAFICFACNTVPDVTPPKNDALLLYPNPATDVVNISVNIAGGETFTVSVFGTDGDVFFEESSSGPDADFKVQLHGEPNGTWHAVLKTQTSTVTRQFFKQ